jgi:insulysin
VNDSLTEFSYNAELAGLTYIFIANELGVSMSLGGYNHKMNVLGKHILDKAKGLVVDPSRLEVMKEMLKKEWENFYLDQPSRISDYYGKHLLSYQNWNLAEKLAEVSCESF